MNVRRRWAVGAGGVAIVLLVGMTAAAVLAYRELRQEFGEYVLLSAGALIDVAGVVPGGEGARAAPRMLAADYLHRAVMLLKLVNPEIAGLGGPALACCYRVASPEGRQLLEASQFTAGGADLGHFLDEVAPAVIEESGRVRSSMNCSFVRTDDSAASK